MDRKLKGYNGWEYERKGEGAGSGGREGEGERKRKWKGIVKHTTGGDVISHAVAVQFQMDT